MHERLPRRLTLAVAVVLAMAASAGSARANDLFTLDTQATTPGSLAQDAAGTAYVTWVHNAASAPDTPMFCKIPRGGTCSNPISLPIPGAVDATDEVSGVFPVLGPGETVYVIGPRFVERDVVIWTSLNGGQSFNGGTLNPGGYPNQTSPTEVLRTGGAFLIDAFNPGVGFGEELEGGGPGQNFSFSGVTGSVGTSTMGLTEGNPVIAYWTLSDPNSMFFFRYKGPGFIFEPASWEGPKAIGNGYETKLAGGPSGLFLLSQDYAGGTNPSAVDVRKLEGADFGAPHTLVNDPSPDLFTGGDIAQSPNGRIAVVWPGYRAGDNARVMRLYTSTDGGASFGPEVDVARIGTSYAINDNAQLTVGDDGGGWVTFSDSAGLRMADLSPVAPYVPPPPPKPPVYKGKTKVITSPVDGNLLTLRLPKSCLQQQQPFFAGVGKKARRKVRKSVRAKLKVVKVSFFFDGRKLATKKKKPFRILIEPGPLPPGSTHVVKARVTARVRKHGHKKKVVRILQGTIKIC